MQVYVFFQYSPVGKVHSIGFYNAETGELLHTVETRVDPYGYILRTAISPNDKLLAIATKRKSVELWDISDIYQTKKVASTETEKLVESLVFLDEETIFFLDEAGVISVWRNPFAAESRSDLALTLDKRGGIKIEITPEGKCLVWSNYHTMKMWKIKEDFVLEKIQLKEGKIDQSSIQTLWSSFLTSRSSAIMSPNNRFIIPEFGNDAYYETEMFFEALKRSPEDLFDCLYLFPGKDMLLALEWVGKIKVYYLEENVVKAARYGTRRQDRGEIYLNKDGKKFCIKSNSASWNILDSRTLETIHTFSVNDNRTGMFIIDTSL